MAEDFIALAGELAYEGNRLTRGLRKLEPSSGLDFFEKSLQRINILTKTLIDKVTDEHLINCKEFLDTVIQTIKTYTIKYHKHTHIEACSEDVKVDKVFLECFKPILNEMLETFVEYCIETKKERIARKKNELAHIQLDILADINHIRFRILCDGNGIAPPLISEQGFELAKTGIRAQFDGKPGRWSAWTFFMPISLGSIRCALVEINGLLLSIPAWAITKQIGPLPATFNETQFQNIFELTKDLEPHAIKCESSIHGGKYILEISAGLNSLSYLVDVIHDVDDFFMKPLDKELNPKNRFLGVIVHEDNKLSLVIDPTFLVYGEDIDET